LESTIASRLILTKAIFGIKIEKVHWGEGSSLRPCVKKIDAMEKRVMNNGKQTGQVSMNCGKRNVVEGLKQKGQKRNRKNSETK